MKSYIIRILLLFTFVFQGIAQKPFKNSDRKNNYLSINTLGLITGFYELQYERLLSKKTSLKIGVGKGVFLEYTNYNDQKILDELFQETFGTDQYNNGSGFISEGYSFNIDYRYFFTKPDAPSGVFISPSFQYRRAVETYSYLDQNNNYRKTKLAEVDYNVFNFRGIIGIQALVKNFLILTPYLGTNVLFWSGENTSNVNRKGTGLELSLGLDLGFAF